MSKDMKKGPKFVNRMKLKQPICNEHGDAIDLTVGEVYEVTFQTIKMTDDEGNIMGEFMSAVIDGHSSRFLPEAFSDFFEQVEEDEKTVQELSE